LGDKKRCDKSAVLYCRTEIGKKEMKKRLKKHFIDCHWGMEIPNEPPQIINEALESDDEL